MNVIQNAIAYIRGHTIDAAIAGITGAITRLEAVIAREEANFIAHERALVAAAKAKEQAFEQRVKATRIASKLRAFIEA